METLTCSSCSHTISCSSKLPLMFLQLHSNTEHVFYLLITNCITTGGMWTTILRLLHTDLKRKKIIIANNINNLTATKSGDQAQFISDVHFWKVKKQKKSINPKPSMDLNGKLCLLMGTSKGRVKHWWLEEVPAYQSEHLWQGVTHSI